MLRFLAIALVILIAPSAWASTLPKADFGDRGYLGVGVGPAVGASYDARLSRELLVGASVGSILWPGPTSTRYDLRALYRFVDGGRTSLSIAGILGAWGDTAFAAPLGWPGGIEIGFGLSVPITHDLTGRLNLLVPYYQVPSTHFFDVFYGPSGGIELGYKITPWIEATLGLNGSGGIAGAKLDL